MRLGRTISLALVAACGDNIVVPDQLASPYTSGAVIRARLLVATDFSTLIGWQDTDRNYGCSLAHGDGDCAQSDPEQRFSEESCSLPFTRSGTFPLLTRDDRFYTVGMPYHGLTYARSGGTCTLDAEVFDGFLLDPVEREQLLQLRTSAVGTFEGTPYTATVTSDGSSLITDLGPDTVEDIAAAPSRLRQVFRRAGNDLLIRMLDLSPPNELPGSLPEIYDATLDHKCHPAHPAGASGQIRCFPDSDVVTEVAYATDQCGDADQTTVTAPAPGWETRDAEPDRDGIPVVASSHRCALELAGVWFVKRDGACTTLTGPRFQCEPIDADTLADFEIEID